MFGFVKKPVDLTDKLAKKHGSLVQKNVIVQRNDVDYFSIFSLTFSLLLMASEPLFIFIWQLI
ncbi:MAG: hypothetical protein LBB05_00160 [Puniceicoccales bacterium]|jgi:hypothetical protein|nr:hypothetical protein [Puniceicoccales bacterium]